MFANRCRSKSFFKMAGESEDKLPAHSQPSLNLPKFRKLIRSYIDLQHYHTALYWADKVASLSNDAQDIYCLAQCLYLTKQYHRASHCIRSRRLDDIYLSCRYLAARCHYESKEYQEAIDVLEQNHFLKPLAKHHEESLSNSIFDPSGSLSPRNLESSLCLLKGKIYEAMDNRGLAAENFQEALQLDIFCYEAFDALIHHQMLTAQEEKDLLESLPFSKQCTEDEAQILRFLYENKLKKYDKPANCLVPVASDNLAENLDVNVNMAERLYYNCSYQECFEITSDVLNKDSFHSECLPIHIACLVELSKSNALFYLAHKLVDLYPQNAVAWFAVGCYYLLIGKNDPARRYLSKATTLDRVFGPAWLAYGHSFAVENEHDQAMAAYFKASQLMKGCHLPLLYIGLEYGLTNNSKLAERFFTQALTIAPEDPFVLHEMGVIAFQNKDWAMSEKYYKEALQKVQAVHHTVLTDKWEPLLNNLGHTCRKLKKYSEALEYHQQALLLSPQNPSTFSAIGYVYALMGNNALAVDYFHKALGIRRDDTFSTTMLGHVIEQLMNDMSPCEGVVEVPVFEFLSENNTNSKTESPAVSIVEPSTDMTANDSMAIEVEMEDNF